MAPLILVSGMVLLLFLAVARGVADDVSRYGHLSEATANVTAAVFLLDAMIVFVAAAGHVVPLDLSSTLALVVGLPLLVVGLGMAGAACRALGSRARLLGISIDTVVTTNAFGISRHPFYLGWSLALFGAAISGRSTVALVLAVVTAMALGLVAWREERVLTGQMREAYGSYRQRTRRLLGRRAPVRSGSRTARLG